MRSGWKKRCFNVECEQGWLVNTEKVEFDTADGWKKYVDSKRLEITCGEAPYIVSRYDAATGELLEIRQRIGILDRKLRVVNENTDSATEWFKWVLRAYQSVYGYEFQGDSLLIARINLLITFVDYMQDRWGESSNRCRTAKDCECYCLEPVADGWNIRDDSLWKAQRGISSI